MFKKDDRKEPLSIGWRIYNAIRLALLVVIFSVLIYLAYYLAVAYYY